MKTQKHVNCSIVERKYICYVMLTVLGNQSVSVGDKTYKICLFGCPTGQETF